MQEMQETQVQYLGQEEPLEQELATNSSILAWKISQTEEPGGSYSPWGRKEMDMTEQLITPIQDKKRMEQMNSTFFNHFQKGKATHSSIAWRITWTVQSMGLQSQTRLSDFHRENMLFFSPLKFLLKGNVSPRMHACSVVYDSLQPHELQPPRLLYPWIAQARIPECVAISFFRRSSLPRDRTHVSRIGRQILLTLRHLGSLTISPSVQFSSVAQSCPTLCNPMNCSTPGLPVHHQHLEFTQTQHPSSW